MLRLEKALHGNGRASTLSPILVKRLGVRLWRDVHLPLEVEAKHGTGSEAALCRHLLNRLVCRFQQLLGEHDPLLEQPLVGRDTQDIAERLAGSVTGTILPFSFNPELELVIYPSLLENEEIYFNVARLDRSIVLKTSDYVAVQPAPGANCLGVRNR